MSSTELEYIHDRTRRSSSFATNRNKKAQFSQSMTYGDNFNHRNQFRGPRERRQEGRAQILIYNIPPDVTDQTVRESLFREFKPFGEVSVYLHGRGEERFATVNFRNPENASHVKELYLERRWKIMIYEKQLSLEFDADYLKSGKSLNDSHTNLSSARRGFAKGRSSFQSDFYHDDHRYDHGNHSNFNRNRGFNQRGNKSRNYGPYNNRDGVHDHDAQYNEPSRTLFVGGLESTINARELTRIFERFGVVEDVYIKRHTDTQGKTYAFVRFNDPDTATQAKVAMTGQVIGRNICKIGYGVSSPTKCLWVGGLGPWASIEELTREFDRFGAIREISYEKGDNCAYILYDSLDAASVAAREMKGYPFGGTDRRLRIDFADPDFNTRTRRQAEYDKHHYDDLCDQNDNRRTSREKDMMYRGNRYRPESQERTYSTKSWSEGDLDLGDVASEGKDDGGQRNFSFKRGRKRSRSPLPNRKRSTDRLLPRGKDEGWGKNRGAPSERSHEFTSRERSRKRSLSPSHRSRDGNDEMSSDEPREKSGRSERTMKSPRKASDGNSKLEKQDMKENGHHSKVENLADVAKRFAVAWRGALGLKSSAFPVRLHLVGGNPELADNFLRGSGTGAGQTKVLSVTQRLRLDPPKLEEVNRRLTSAGASGHCILLGLPSGQSEELDLSDGFQSRPLRILVSYFQKKQAAGVIPLGGSTGESVASGNKDKDEGGILHAFPPCEYSHQQLLKVAPNLGQESMKEDHLVMILVRGTATI